MPAKTVLGNISPCNVVPPILKPKVGAKTDNPSKADQQSMEDLFEELGLNEPKEWMTKEDIQEAKKLV